MYLSRQVNVYPNLKAKKKKKKKKSYRSYLGFCPDPKHFIVDCEPQNVFRQFDKIKCYADRPYLVFFRAEIWNTYMLFFCLSTCCRWSCQGWLVVLITSQSTIFQSCRDGAIASWVINQYFRGVKCLAQGHNTAAVGFEPRTSRSGVRHSTTEPPRSPCQGWKPEQILTHGAPLFRQESLKANTKYTAYFELLADSFIRCMVASHNSLRNLIHLGSDMTKPTKWLCAQRRLRSAWASAQSDQSLRCPHEETWVLSY